LASALALSFLLAAPTARAQSSSAGDCSALGSVGGNFNPNCNNTYNAPPRLALTDDIKNLLLQKIPKANPINFKIIGSPDDQTLGMQFVQFLKENGYTIGSVASIGMISPPPDRPLEWDAAGSTLMISPATPPASPK
jgi:hypothetical protein